jgi:hypothetical protein
MLIRSWSNAKSFIDPVERFRTNQVALWNSKAIRPDPDSFEISGISAILR